MSVEQDEGYLAPRRTGAGEIRDRGSRFLAIVEPARDEAAAKSALEAIRERYREATHHCWAWRLGQPPVERSSDDGEPSGTAGIPILQVLRGAELSDVLAVVVRWYGGTKLGKGGLARAYAESTRVALGELPTRRIVPTESVAIEFPYQQVGAIKRLIRPPQIRLAEETYGESVRFELVVHSSQRGELDAALAEFGIEVLTGS